MWRTLRTPQHRHLFVVKTMASAYFCSHQHYSRYSYNQATSSGSFRVVDREGGISRVALNHIFTPLRRRGYNFYINLEDPEDTRRSVEEDLERLAEENRTDTTAYLHSLLNLALSHYQSQEYIKARKVAEYAHERALQHNNKSSFIYLTAKTCSHCAVALANEYEEHLMLVEARAETSSTLAPKPSVVFSARRTIKKLREDAVRYDGIAARVYNRPDLAFMRGRNGRENRGCRSEDVGGAGTRNGGPGSRSSNDRRRTWSEDECLVDEEFEAQYGPRWQERRKRPEHAEIRRFYQRQQPRDAQGESWEIPK